MKYAVMYSYGFETSIKNKKEIEKIIREKELNVSLIIGQDGEIKVISLNYAHLWLLLFILSSRDEWEIY